MLERARGIKRKVKADNVSFVESRITKIDYPGATADCVISNCVVNLVPAAEKQAAFDEMFRLLKPGGRIAISDILLKQDLPEELKSNVALYVGCVAGASRVDACENYMRKAGFKGRYIMIDADLPSAFCGTDRLIRSVDVQTSSPCPTTAT